MNQAARAGAGAETGGEAAFTGVGSGAGFMETDGGALKQRSRHSLMLSKHLPQSRPMPN